MHITNLPAAPCSLAGFRKAFDFTLTPEELAAIEPVIAENDRLQALVSSYSGERKNAELDALRKAFVDDPSPENQKAIEEAELNQRQAMEDAHHLRKLAKTALRGLSERNGEVVLPALRRLRGELTELADSREAGERELSEELGIPHSPGPIVQALRGRAVIVGSQIDAIVAGGGVNPRRALAGLID